MSNFDKDKIKNMEYDPSRGRYVGNDGSEFKSTPYSDGRGYKYDYYDSSTYGNTSHNSTHVKSDLSENWHRVDNDRSNGTQDRSSGTGCYLTSSCMKHMQSNFDDNCDELLTLRWCRDTFVGKEDVKHYYDVAPAIVEAIEHFENKDVIYDYIYKNIVSACVIAIKNGEYEFAYDRYKNSVLALEEQFINTKDKQSIPKTLKLIPNN